MQSICIALGFIITLAFLWFISNALVEGFCDGKNIHHLIRLFCKAILLITMLGILFCMSKCEGVSSNEYTPTGETTLEHYEPR